MSSHAVHFAAKLGREWWSVNTMTHYVDRPPTIEQLALLMGVSLSTAERAARELQAKEYLVISKYGRGRYTYQFRAPQLTLGLSFADAKALVSAKSHAAHWGSDPSRVTPQAISDPSRVTGQAISDPSRVTGQDMCLKKERAGARAASLRSLPNKNDERGEPDRSLVVALLQKEELTDEQIADALTFRTDEEIRDHVAAMDYRKYAVRVKVLVKSLMTPYTLPAKYLQAKERAAQLPLRTRGELEQKRAAAIVADPNPPEGASWLTDDEREARTLRARRAAKAAAFPQFARQGAS